MSVPHSRALLRYVSRFPVYSSINVIYPIVLVMSWKVFWSSEISFLFFFAVIKLFCYFQMNIKIFEYNMTDIISHGNVLIYYNLGLH